MKKVLIGLFVCLALSSLILIQGAGEQQGSGNSVTTQTDTSLKTQNSGEASELQNQILTQLKLQVGNYLSESGIQLQVQTMENNRIELKSGNAKAETGLEITSEETTGGKVKLQVKLDNGEGRNAEVKIMPETASETALERLRLKVCNEENDCKIELKQVGQGEQAKLAYEVQAERHAKLFGLFRTKLQVRAQIDAENGEVIQTKKPWWAFLTVDAETEVEAVV